MILLLLLLFLIIMLIFAMRARGDPQSAFAILHRGILTAEVDALALFAVAAGAALGEVAGAGGELGFDGGVGGDPVGEGVFAVLDDAVEISYILDSIVFGGGRSKSLGGRRNVGTYALLAS